MRDSVPTPRYSPICNVLRQWKPLLIPTYRVYRLYDMLFYHSLNFVKLLLLYFANNIWYIYTPHEIMKLIVFYAYIETFLYIIIIISI